MWEGVSKSGSPISRWMISRPCAASALAFASVEKAVSVPRRSIRLASFTPVLLCSGRLRRPPLHHTPVCSHVTSSAPGRPRSGSALFSIRERSAHEPERLCGAAPGERDARPAVPVVVDPRWAVGYILQFEPYLRAARPQARFVLQHLGLRETWLERRAAPQDAG